MLSLEEMINSCRESAAASMIVYEQLKRENDKRNADIVLGAAERLMQIADWLSDYKRLLGVGVKE